MSHLPKPKDVPKMLKQEIDSLDVDETCLAVGEHIGVKNEFHAMVMDQFVNPGKCQDMTQREFGLLMVAEGLTIMAAHRFHENAHTNN